MNRHPTGVQPNATNRRSDNDQEEVDECQKCFGRRTDPFTLVDEQPEYPRDPVREP